MIAALPKVTPCAAVNRRNAMTTFYRAGGMDC